MTNHAHACRRCRGMMVETYSDLLSPNDHGEAVFVWRCVNCGDYVDRHMLQNQLSQGEGLHITLSVRRHKPVPLRVRAISTHHHMEAA